MNRLLPVLLSTALVLPAVQAAQPGWPPMFGNPSAQPRAAAGSPFARQAPQGQPLPRFPFARSQPQRRVAPGFPFAWMGGGSPAPTASPWNAYTAPPVPFGGQSGFSPFNPMAMMGGTGGMGNMGMMTAPMMQGMMGFMAPMMTNYAIASMNPTTMGNFFGLMTNPGSGMMPFGGFGFPGGGYGAPAAPFQSQGNAFPWSTTPAAPWSRPAAPKTFGGSAQSGPVFPPFFPFSYQGGGRR